MSMSSSPRFEPGGYAEGSKWGRSTISLSRGAVEIDEMLHSGGRMRERRLGVMCEESVAKSPGDVLGMVFVVEDLSDAVEDALARVV